MQIALIYEALTALDPDPTKFSTRFPVWRFVAKQPGPIRVDSGAFSIGVDHKLADVPRPDVFVVPGGVAGTFAAAGFSTAKRTPAPATAHPRTGSLQRALEELGERTLAPPNRGGGHRKDYCSRRLARDGRTLSLVLQSFDNPKAGRSRKPPRHTRQACSEDRIQRWNSNSPSLRRRHTSAVRAKPYPPIIIAIPQMGETGWLSTRTTSRGPSEEASNDQANVTRRIRRFGCRTAQ